MAGRGSSHAGSGGSGRCRPHPRPAHPEPPAQPDPRPPAGIDKVAGKSRIGRTGLTRGRAPLPDRYALLNKSPQLPTIYLLDVRAGAWPHVGIYFLTSAVQFTTRLSGAETSCVTALNRKRLPSRLTS